MGPSKAIKKSMRKINELNENRIEMPYERKKHDILFTYRQTKKQANYDAASPIKEQ